MLKAKDVNHQGTLKVHTFAHVHQPESFLFSIFIPQSQNTCDDLATWEATGGINMLRAHINFNKNNFLWKLQTEQIKIRINGFSLISQELFSEHSVFSWSVLIKENKNFLDVRVQYFTYAGNLQISWTYIYIYFKWNAFTIRFPLLLLLIPLTFVLLP